MERLAAVRDAQLQEAAVVLSVLRERGRRGLPCTQLDRQMFSKDLYLLAYGNIYPGKGGDDARGRRGDR